MSGPFVPMLARGLRLAWRRPVDALVGLAFFVLVVGLIPLALVPDAAARPAMAGAASWIAAVLAAMVSSLRLFGDDAASGALDQLLLAPGGAVPAMAGLLAAHVTVTALPLVLVSPLLALFFDLHAKAWAALAAALLLGLPALCLLAALGAALTHGARAGAVLLGVVVLPWCVPVLLFGIRAAQPGETGALLLVAAVSLACAALVPRAVVAALKLGAG
nr:heme exporter protein CcmB [uncultured Caldimonas sp.]